MRKRKRRWDRRDEKRGVGYVRGDAGLGMSAICLLLPHSQLPQYH